MSQLGKAVFLSYASPALAEPTATLREACRHE